MCGSLEFETEQARRAGRRFAVWGVGVRRMGMEMLMSVEEVGELCGLSRRAVYRAIERGELTASRICHRLRIEPVEVEAWIRREQVQVVRQFDPPPPRSRLAAACGLRRLLDEEA